MTAGEFPFLKLPSIHALPKARFRIIRGLRVVVACAQFKRDPLPELGVLFGCQEAAHSFHRLMHLCGQRWPDPFMVQPPCCSHTSYDEILFTDLITAVVLSDRAKFDSLIFEMLDKTARDDLFEGFMQFVRPFRVARGSEAFNVDTDTSGG